MDAIATAPVGRTDGWDAGPGVLPAMLTVDQVAGVLGCSPRTVRRLTDSGRMPRPIRLGALLRWPRQTIESWIRQGCPRAKDMEVVR